MSKTLHLTTPHMHGPAVSKLQAELHRHGYYRGALDGEYGPATAQAVYRAKFWLGYISPDQVAGDVFMSFLTGKKKPWPSMVLLATKRRRAQQQTPLRLKALKALTSKLGTKESPAGSNRCWATAWYRLIGPWCAMSVSWAYVQAGSKSFRAGSHYSYVPYIVADARAGRNNLTITHHPQPGDIVCYDWNKDGTADHVGLFERWTSGTSFTAIEGNTGVGNDSNGGEVMRRDRDRSLVQAFIHVGK